MRRWFAFQQSWHEPKQRKGGCARIITILSRCAGKQTARNRRKGGNLQKQGKDRKEIRKTGARRIPGVATEVGPVYQDHLETTGQNQERAKDWERWEHLVATKGTRGREGRRMLRVEGYLISQGQEMGSRPEGKRRRSARAREDRKTRGNRNQSGPVDTSWEHTPGPSRNRREQHHAPTTTYYEEKGC